MREIKFRVWSRKDGKWITDFDEIVIAKKIGEEEEFCVNPNPCSYPNEGDVELMQNTGLQDKNGRDIYEGDIVAMDSWNPKNVQIKFIEGAFCLAFLGGEFDGDFAGDIHYIHHAGIPQAAVIGNIYENNNLLTT